ncbi:ankyrin repeat domain-containing protein 45 [Triplophysa dalaica]|uniref:ankyrin repeat domain-containing protein 45 n=1 Tax=Triplophysa dalaica TaxID=1582913 RepID=UPI0024DF5667|nr:ankyrin repeat domain-containing protein 45 [Triplophysa dalaica]
MQGVVEKTIFSCALEDDVEGLKSLLGSNSDSDNEQSRNIMREKDEVGRSALFTACMLGRSCILRELVKNGADVNELTVRGYSPLHSSAMWGQLDTLKTLVELNADLQATNFLGEKAVDVARRYCKPDCEEYLAWADAKQDLQALINRVKETIADAEKGPGKLNKADKNICINTCSAKSDWMQSTKNATIQEFIEQKNNLESVVEPILLRLNTMSETPTKTRKH